MKKILITLLLLFSITLTGCTSEPELKNTMIITFDTEQNIIEEGTTLLNKFIEVKTRLTESIADDYYLIEETPNPSTMQYKDSFPVIDKEFYDIYSPMLMYEEIITLINDATIYITEDTAITEGEQYQKDERYSYRFYEHDGVYIIEKYQAGLAPDTFNVQTKLFTFVDELLYLEETSTSYDMRHEYSLDNYSWYVNRFYEDHYAEQILYQTDYNYIMYRHLDIATHQGFTYTLHNEKQTYGIFDLEKNTNVTFDNGTILSTKVAYMNNQEFVMSVIDFEDAYTGDTISINMSYVEGWDTYYPSSQTLSFEDVINSNDFYFSYRRNNDYNKYLWLVFHDTDFEDFDVTLNEYDLLFAEVTRATIEADLDYIRNNYTVATDYLQEHKGDMTFEAFINSKITYRIDLEDYRE